MGMTDDGSSRGFRVDRPFGWGILLIGDSASPGVPATEPGVAVVATQTVVAAGFGTRRTLTSSLPMTGRKFPSST
jgi:hypothetical protein